MPTTYINAERVDQLTAWKSSSSPDRWTMAIVQGPRAEFVEYVTEAACLAALEDWRDWINDAKA